MNNELKLSSNTFQVSPGSIQFPEYESLLDDSKRLLEMMKSSVVNEDTVQVNKKLLAKVRSQRRDLETLRKDAKSTILAPYTELETKVKNIVSIIDEADSVISTQVKELDEQEKLKKKEEIRELFDLRLEMYTEFPLTFEQYLIEFPKVLNKSETITKVEKSLGEWFESKQSDLAVISNLQNADEVMIEYISHPDSLSRSISIVQSRVDQMKKAREVVKNNNPEIKEFKFKVHTIEDAQTLEQFMNNNNIKYTTY